MTELAHVAALRQIARTTCAKDVYIAFRDTLEDACQRGWTEAIKFCVDELALRPSNRAIQAAARSGRHALDSLRLDAFELRRSDIFRIACITGAPNVVGYCIEAGMDKADVNHEALQFACRQARVEIVAAILRMPGMTPEIILDMHIFMPACASRSIAVLELVCDRLAGGTAVRNCLLFGGNNCAGVRQIFATGTPDMANFVCERVGDSPTIIYAALVAAATAGRADLTRCVLERKRDLAFKTLLEYRKVPYQFGASAITGTHIPIRVACTFPTPEHIDVVRAYIEHGATPAELQVHWSDAAMRACANHTSPDLLELLYERIGAAGLADDFRSAVWWAKLRRRDGILLWLASKTDLPTFVAAFVTDPKVVGVSDQIAAAYKESSARLPGLAKWLEKQINMQ